MPLRTLLSADAPSTKGFSGRAAPQASFLTSFRGCIYNSKLRSMGTPAAHTGPETCSCQRTNGNGIRCGYQCIGMSDPYT